MGELVGGVVGLTFLAAAVAAYFAPWVIAVWYDHRNQKAIGLLNLFLGWTLVGWVVALIWAVYRPTPVRA